MSEEDDDVVEYVVQVPTNTLSVPDAYPYGTELSLSVLARVKGYSLVEDRKGNLVHKHMLAVDEVKVVDSLTPVQRRAIVEGAIVVEEPELDEVQY